MFKNIIVFFSFYGVMPVVLKQGYNWYPKGSMQNSHILSEKMLAVGQCFFLYWSFTFLDGSLAFNHTWCPSFKKHCCICKPKLFQRMFYIYTVKGDGGSWIHLLQYLLTKRKPMTIVSVILASAYNVFVYTCSYFCSFGMMNYGKFNQNMSFGAVRRRKT